MCCTIRKGYYPGHLRIVLHETSEVEYSPGTWALVYPKNYYVEFKFKSKHDQFKSDVLTGLDLLTYPWSHGYSCAGKRLKNKQEETLSIDECETWWRDESSFSDEKEVLPPDLLEESQKK